MSTTRVRPPNSLTQVLAVLAEADEPIDAVEIAAACSTKLQQIRAALSIALNEQRVHVAFTKKCKGGRRRFYRIGLPVRAADSRPDPLETLRAMQACATESGRIRK